MKSIVKILPLVLVLSLQNLIGQTWNLLIPSSSYDNTRLNFSNTAFNQSESSFYSLYKSGSTLKIQKFNLNANSVVTVNTSNIPNVDMGSFTYDYTNNRVIGNRAGRENLFAFPANGGNWTQIGTGTTDAESYGASFFWNPSNNKTAFFGGYGFFFTKNWIWENNGTWTNPYVNNSLCNNTNPAKRVCNLALGAPNSNKLFIFSGQGSCSGQQTATSCSLGSPWGTDVGVSCWLRDFVVSTIRSI